MVSERAAETIDRPKVLADLRLVVVLVPVSGRLRRPPVPYPRAHSHPNPSWPHLDILDINLASQAATRPRAPRPLTIMLW